MSYTKEKMNAIVKSFVEKLEDGCAPWVRPFAITKGGGDFPINRRTHKPYRGINVLILWLTANVRGFSSRYWLTFKQAQQLSTVLTKNPVVAKLLRLGVTAAKTGSLAGGVISSRPMVGDYGLEVGAIIGCPSRATALNKAAAVLLAGVIVSRT